MGIAACADGVLVEPDADVVTRDAATARDAQPAADAAVAADAEVTDAAPSEGDATPAPDVGPGADAGFVDAELSDTGFADAELSDTGFADAEQSDTGFADAEAIDAGSPDASAPDASAPDASAPDAAPQLDAGAPDAGAAGRVVPLYPLATRWNDYVRADGLDALSASGAPCVAASDGPRFDACVHAGELRAFAVPGRNTCAGISAQDTLQAFSWTCLEGTSPVRVVSTGLAVGRRLSDLLDWSAAPVGWRTNQVRVLDNATLIQETSPEIWWANPVVTSSRAGTYPGRSNTISAAGLLGSAGTIYAITATTTDGSYELAAEKVAVVTGPGVKLTSVGQHPAINGANAPFSWVEAATGSASNYGISIGSGVRFGVVSDSSVDGARGGVVVGSTKSLVRRLTVRNLSATSPTEAVMMTGGFNLVDGVDAENVTGGVTFLGNDNVVRNVHIATGSGEAFRFTSGPRNLLVDAHASTVTWGATLDNGADGNVLVRVRVSNCSRYGFEVRSSGNLFVDVEASNTGNGGLVLLAPNNRVLGGTFVGAGVGAGQSAGTVMMAVTSAHTLDGAGFSFGTSRNNDLAALAVVNARWNTTAVASGGVVFDGTAARTSELHAVYGLASAHHDGLGLNLDNIYESRFDGPLLLGSNTLADCQVTAGSNPGLTQIGTGCVAQGASTAVVTTGVSLVGAFVGPVTTDDPIAPDDVTGTALRASITDWAATSATHRLWARAGSSIADPAARGRCIGTNTCQLWDFGLSAADTVLRERLPLPDGDDVVLHTWSAAAAGPCGVIAGGATWTGTACQSTFLRGAIELLEDGTGDDDGLCESNEACLYLPNLGAYQGDGPLVSAGAFVDGQLTGITLLRRATNGR
jgi:hypothetical protein